jgi:hypothetical protein
MKTGKNQRMIFYLKSVRESYDRDVLWENGWEFWLAPRRLRSSFSFRIVNAGFINADLSKWLYRFGENQKEFFWR